MEIINRAKRVGLGTEHPARTVHSSLRLRVGEALWRVFKAGQPSWTLDLVRKEVSCAPPQKKISELFYSLFLFVYFSLD